MGNGALAIGPKLPRPSSTLPKLKPSIPHRSALRKKGPSRKPLSDSFLTDDAITSSMTSLQKFENWVLPFWRAAGYT